MYYFCISFTLLFAASFGLRLEQFTQTTDYNAFFDRLLVSVQNLHPMYLPRPPLNLDVIETGTNDSTPIASISSPNPMVGNFRSAKRISEVIYKLSSGNLTLETNVSIGNFMLSYPGSTISIFGVSSAFSALVTVKKNVIGLGFTLFSTANRSCALDLWLAEFRNLGDVGISVNSLGFFNFIKLGAQFLHIDQNILKNSTFEIDAKPLKEAFENGICSQVVD